MKKQFAWICVVDVAGILILVFTRMLCANLVLALEVSFWH